MSQSYTTSHPLPLDPRMFHGRPPDSNNRYPQNSGVLAPVLPQSQPSMMYAPGGIMVNAAASQESIPASLAAKLDGFYLQTSTVNTVNAVNAVSVVNAVNAVNATPAFSSSPTFLPSIYTPSLLTTPMLENCERFDLETKYDTTRYPSTEFIAGGGYEGLQIGLERLDTAKYFAPDALDYFVSFRDDSDGLGPTIEDILVEDPFSDIPTTLDPTGNISDVDGSMCEDLDGTSVAGNTSINNSSPMPAHPMGNTSMTHTIPNGDMAHAVPSTLNAVPSAMSNTNVSIKMPITMDSMDSIHNSMVETDVDLVDAGTDTASPNDAVASFLDLDELPSPNVPVRKPPSRSSPLPRLRTRRSYSKLNLTSGKLIRKLKSFTTGSKHFSLEELLSEFHIAEGNFAFQDETARLTLQLGPGLAVTKKKSMSKLPKLFSKPELRKAKTTTNVCVQHVMRSSPKMLKSMESGLLSFQLNLNPPAE